MVEEIPIEAIIQIIWLVVLSLLLGWLYLNRLWRKLCRCRGK